MIILIALGVIVLIIAVLMFRNSTQKGQEAASNCELLGGTCMQGCTPSQPNYYGTCSKEQKDKGNVECCARPTP